MCIRDSAGAENIGASVIPMSSGNTEKQITLMHDFGSTVLCCTPSYAPVSYTHLDVYKRQILSFLLLDTIRKVFHEHL